MCHLAVSATSFERAAEIAGRQGIATDAGHIRRVALQVGERAETEAARRESAAFDPKENRTIARTAGRELSGERFSMVLMLDGMMLRSRGQDWGMKPALAPGERVSWHEVKAGLVIRLPESPTRKRQLFAKYYVASDGGPDAVGRKLYAEALRRGLEQAQQVYVIADGAVWIWRVAEEHFPGSIEALDFYHASEHVWALSRALWEDDEEQMRQWAIPLLHALKHRGGEELLFAVSEFQQKAVAEGWGDSKRQVLDREAAYFRNHAPRMDYPGFKRRGFPIGSGAMESACSQLQGRFKCPGQFWSRLGERKLMALALAWRNRDWNELWAQSA
ncbi:MAG: hypothetical protein FWG74_05595 [Planctomycetes bacterium]|nr:hypothetical protein [Planctomycetota bacterium]